MLLQPAGDSLSSGISIRGGTGFTPCSRRLISAHLLDNSNLAGVLLRRQEFDALPRHILHLPGTQFHFLPVHDFNWRLFYSLLVALELLRASMRADLVVLLRLLLFNIFPFPLPLHVVNV